jgi:hypothetical protein
MTFWTFAALHAKTGHELAVPSSPNPASVSVFWLCDEARHFRGMELALNGVHCRANNCFDINGTPHLGEQMNAEPLPHMGRNRMVSVFPSARNPDTTWAATIEHHVLYLMSASLVSRAVGIFTSMM